MLSEYHQSISELAWHYLRMGADVPIRGQSYEGRGGSFDEAAVSRLHEARAKVIDRNEDENGRRERIARTVTVCGHEAILADMFRPRGSVSAVVDAYFTVEGVRLFDVAVMTSEAMSAIEADGRRRSAEGLDPLDPTEWFERQMRSLEKMRDDLERLRTNKPAGGVFERILREATGIGYRALAAYDVARRDRIAAEQAARNEFHDRKMAELHERLWGASS